MRITILAHVEPGANETFSDLVGEVAAALRKGGHRVAILDVGVDVGRLISGLKRRQPDLIFNLMDVTRDDGPAIVAVLGLLDLLGLPYTGCGPGELYVQSDPELFHNLLVIAGLPVACPQRGSATSRPANRIAALIGTRPSEFSVGVVGNDESEAFVPIYAGEMNTSATGVESCIDEARQLAASAYEVLRGRDYGLVQLRLSATQVQVAGATMGCSLERDGDFVQSSSAAGVDFAALVNRIADSALERAERRQLVRLI